MSCQLERVHPGHLAAVDEDLARVGPDQADDLLEQDGLALAAAADEGDDFTVAHGEVHAVMDDFAAEGHPNVAQFHGGSGGRRGRRGDVAVGLFGHIRPLPKIATRALVMIRSAARIRMQLMTTLWVALRPTPTVPPVVRSP